MKNSFVSGKTLDYSLVEQNKPFPFYSAAHPASGWPCWSGSNSDLLRPMEKSFGIVYSPRFSSSIVAMSADPRAISPKERQIHSGMAGDGHGRTSLDDVEGLLAQLQSLRHQGGGGQRLKVLDLLYSHAVHDPRPVSRAA